MSTIVVSILSSILGSGTIIYILQRLIINSFTEQQRHTNALVIEEMKKQYAESLEDIKKNHQKEIENHKIILNNYSRYSDEQFKLYNDFWSSLCDLKKSAEILWDNASTDNLWSFASQLRETKEKLEKNIFLIEDNHYQTLDRIFDAFSRFSLGKTTLIQLSSRRRTDAGRVDTYIVNELINSNREIKEEYNDLILEISKSFKKHIYYSNPS